MKENVQKKKIRQDERACFHRNLILKSTKAGEEAGVKKRKNGSVQHTVNDRSW